MAEQETIPRTVFDAGRSDWFIRGAKRLLPGGPVGVGFSYGFLALGGAWALAGLGDLLRGTGHLQAALGDFQNILNVGLVVPVGFMVVITFHDRVNQAFRRLIDEGILVFASSGEQRSFLKQLDALFNRSWFLPLSLLISLVNNAYFVMGHKDEAWHALSAGPHAWWFRLFSIMSMAVMYNTILKGISTVQAIGMLFDGHGELRLQPLHPDRCAGLRPLGRVTNSVTYLLAITAIYVTILRFVPSEVDQQVTIEIARGVSMFSLTMLVFVLMASYLFFVPLLKAHQMMKSERARVLAALNQVFQRHYRRFTDGADDFDDDDLRNVQTVERLYDISAQMPVWPFDMSLITQFAATIALPVVVLLGKIGIELYFALLHAG